MLDDVRNRARAAAQASDWPALAREALRIENLICDAERRAHAEGETPPWWTGVSAAGAETYLVTGAAGFVGSHLVRRLLQQGRNVVGLDEFNDYYDPVYKWDNVADLLADPHFTLYQVDVRDIETLRPIFASRHIDVVVHLAARAGVRPSIQDSPLYVTANVLGTQNMLDLAREFEVGNFVYASSSSVYGGNTEFPFSESQNVDHPVSPYAATKRANELQAALLSAASTASRSRGLRFFTVYGPAAGRTWPCCIFIERWTAASRCRSSATAASSATSPTSTTSSTASVGVVRAASGQREWCEVFNLGESDTTTVREMILLVAKELGKIEIRGDVKALPRAEQDALIERLVAAGLVERLPEQLGDVPKTYADVSKARRLAGYDPRCKIAEGVRRTVAGHLEAKKRARDQQRERIRAALRVECGLRVRSGLDSAGRLKDPAYLPADAIAACDAMDQIAGVLASAPRDFLALRGQAELAEPWPRWPPPISAAQEKRGSRA